MAASGTPPLTNQWFCNGRALADATSAVLPFTNAQSAVNGEDRSQP
jgi:hypothetical protein